MRLLVVVLVVALIVAVTSATSFFLGVRKVSRALAERSASALYEHLVRYRQDNALTTMTETEFRVEMREEENRWGPVLQVKSISAEPRLWGIPVEVVVRVQRKNGARIETFYLHSLNSKFTGLSTKAMEER